MFRFRPLLYLFAVSLSFVALIALLSPLQAQNGPQAEQITLQSELIASDLIHPRGMAFAPDGSLYIAESGSGGAGPCIPGPGVEFCYGTTGRISRVEFNADGSPADQTEVLSGLSSLAAKDTGEEATGPNDIAFTESGGLYFLTGLGNDPAVRNPAGPLGAAGMDFGQLMHVDDELMMTKVADVAGYEGAANPDGAQIDSNPYGMLAMGDEFVIADAGGNSLLNVANVAVPTRHAAAADISTIAVFPARMVEFPPGSGSMVPMDSVPTAVEMGPDGAYYVSELTGFPFPVGGANIYRVVPGEEPEVYLTGFTNVLDLAFGPDGSLFVLEMAKDSLLADPPPVGRIIQVTPYGARSVFVGEGLIAPLDIEIGPDYALYVINAGATQMGQVLRYSLPATTAVISAAKDNTLYENEAGALSNGMGQHFFAGVTAAQQGNLIRRGVIAFDVGAAVPAGSTVLSATLELNMSRSIVGDTTVSLHTLQKDWGEGASDAGGEEGGGAASAPGDATWIHSAFDTALWAAAGGDFNNVASAAALVGGTGQYSWSSMQMTADVQNWLDNSGANFGWLLKGDESGGASAKRFDSRENPQAQSQPKLTVSYVVPLPDYAVFAPVVASDQ